MHSDCKELDGWYVDFPVILYLACSSVERCHLIENLTVFVSMKSQMLVLLLYMVLASVCLQTESSNPNPIGIQFVSCMLAVLRA